MPVREPAQSSNRARALEDAFFVDADRELIEHLRAMRKMAETKQALADVSGITNDVVLARLLALGVRPETLAALATVPLIEVAWADGEITPAERDAVLTHANAKGIQPGSMEHALLERWLARRPGPELLESWRAYMQGLCAKMSPEERKLFKEELLHATHSTAKASGGFLGIGSVSRSEKAVLEMLSAGFCE